MAETLIEIFDKDVKEKPNEVIYWKVRNAARAIIFDKDKIAVLHIKKFNRHTLIGGGIDEGESVLQALHREALEEAGCTIKVHEKIATAIEYKTHVSGKQRSTFFIAEVIQKRTPNLTDEEKNSGSVVEWMTIKEAKSIMNKELNSTKNYEGKFSLKRNLFVLKLVKEN